MKYINDLISIDLSKIFFIHSQYLPYVASIALFVLVLYLITRLRILKFYKRYGGYKNCVKVGSANKIRPAGPLRLFAKAVLLMLMTALVGLTLLEPSIKDIGLENEYEPSQIVLVLDSTISMLAEDVTPSRLEAAKKEVTSLIDRVIREGGKDKVALYRFTDIAIPIVARPIQDYELIKQELGRLTPAFLDRFKTHGSNVWDSVTQGIKAFDQDNDQVKILVIVSDGEQQAEPEYIDKIRDEALVIRNKNPDIRIFLVGIGTTEEDSSLIPKKKDEKDNTIEYYTHELGPKAGQFVETRPDRQYMEEVASQINTAREVIVSQSGAELAQELNQILTSERKIVGRRENPEIKNLSPLFILATLLLMLFIPLIKI
ncbi:MAG: VWA domain-containing protein [bacterium]|nr:VWA domain-containing protein [bacterium]